MSAPLEFTKMCAAGNDFILIHDPSGRRVEEGAELARRLCRRRFAVGADGLLLVRSTGAGEIALDYWNADGSAADLCADGARCAARFAVDHGLTGRRARLWTGGALLEAEVAEELERIEMPQTQGPRRHRIEVGAERIELWWVESGVPHAVVLAESPGAWSLEHLAPPLRSHALWGAAGANVDLAHREEGAIVMRSWERGIEGETHSCGTGAVAVALAAARHWGARSPVTIRTRGGDRLEVEFEMRPEGFGGVRLGGAVSVVYRGSMPPAPPTTADRPK